MNRRMGVNEWAWVISVGLVLAVLIGASCSTAILIAVAMTGGRLP